jgi:trans-aconitate methyltransferase
VSASEHWEHIYSARPTTELSWYEGEPITSLRVIDELGLGSTAAIVDVGAGASTLVDRLLAAGFGDLTVLDVSRRALDEVRDRLGSLADLVTFVVHDVVSWDPGRTFDLWHDRAVFHFLVDAEDQARYVRTVQRAVHAGGAVIIAGFAEDGPTHCSGLPVARHTAEALATMFEPWFTLIADQREEHLTPAGVVQPFTWVTLRRS